jgi:hypothetical protein
VGSAEITTFDGSNAQEFDFYDISLVDGMCTAVFVLQLGVSLTP